MADSSIITVDIPELVKKGILPYGTTANPEDVVKGKTFYSNNLEPSTGTLDMNDYEKKLPPQEKTVEPEIVEQEIVADAGYKLSKVTVKEVTKDIDNNIQPYNIKMGVTILGVDGNVEPDKPDQIKEVKPTTEKQEIVADTGFELGKVIIDPILLEEKTIKPTTTQQEIIPTTGIDGLSKVTVEAVELQEKEVNPTTYQQEITPDSGKDGLSKVSISPVTNNIDENIKPENILKDITILGITGTVYPQKEEQEKNVAPTTSEQEVLPDENKVLSKVTVGAVTSDIDPNIESGNIRSGITILGITGTMQGTDDLSVIKYSDNMYQIETGRIPPTDEEYEQIIEKGYKILDYVFRGVTA